MDKRSQHDVLTCPICSHPDWPLNLLEHSVSEVESHYDAADGQNRTIKIGVQIYQSDCSGLPRWLCWLGYKLGKWSCLTHGYFRDNKSHERSQQNPK